LIVRQEHAEGGSINQRGARRWEYSHSQGELNVKPKTALFIGWIVFALAGMTLWATMALADDALEIGKTYYWVGKTYSWVRNREPITIVERTNDEPGWYVIQRQGGEKKELRTWILEEAFKNGELVSELPPPPPPRPKITYSPGEPEGYKNFKWGMTCEETREFHPARQLGSAETYSKAYAGLPFGDSIGPVRVTVSLRFFPSGCAEPESTLSSVLFSFASEDYETLKKIFIERYGKPASLQQEPYKTQGGAESTNEILMWKGPHALIRLSRFGNRITEGSAVMGTNESLEAFSKKRDEEIKDAAKGL
jgi:hypothetical protein